MILMIHVLVLSLLVLLQALSMIQLPTAPPDGDPEEDRRVRLVRMLAVPAHTGLRGSEPSSERSGHQNKPDSFLVVWSDFLGIAS